MVSITECLTNTLEAQKFIWTSDACLSDLTCVSANITLFPGMLPIFSGNQVDMICGLSLWSMHGVILYKLWSNAPVHMIVLWEHCKVTVPKVNKYYRSCPTRILYKNRFLRSKTSLLVVKTLFGSRERTAFSSVV